MIAIVRAIAFVASAIGVELLRGVGVAVFAATLFVGWRRWSLVALAPVVAAGVVLSLLLPEADVTSGKVLHGLSNAPFVVLLHAVIAMLGFGVGRLTRRMLA